MSLIIDLDAEPMMVDPFGDDAAEWLGRLLRDVPPDVELGRTLAAMWDPRDAAMSFLTTAGQFDVFHAHTERLLQFGDGDDAMAEWTSWTGKMETSRDIHRIADLNQPPPLE
jgi:hypothetical protein